MPGLFAARDRSSVIVRRAAGRREHERERVANAIRGWRIALEHVENSKFARLGMDSAMSVIFLLDLEEWLGLALSSVSGYVGADLLVRAQEAGADDVLKKPLSMRELATNLARVLRPSRRRKTVEPGT